MAGWAMRQDQKEAGAQDPGALPRALGCDPLSLFVVNTRHTRVPLLQCLAAQSKTAADSASAGTRVRRWEGTRLGVLEWKFSRAAGGGRLRCSTSCRACSEPWLQRLLFEASSRVASGRGREGQYSLQAHASLRCSVNSY
eukprot:358162-Rhodomonas_salina.1